MSSACLLQVSNKMVTKILDFVKSKIPEESRDVVLPEECSRIDLTALVVLSIGIESYPLFPAKSQYDERQNSKS